MIDNEGSSISGNRLHALWEERWARFADGLLQRGVLAERQKYAVAWVRKFVGFVRPRRVEQAERADIETFLQQLVGEGKKAWQVEQANRALELFFPGGGALEVGPAGLAGNARSDGGLGGAAR